MFQNPTTSLKVDFLHPIFALKKKFMIPNIIRKNLCRAHTEDLTVEVTSASQLEQTEFMLHNTEHLELNKAYFCITPLAGVGFE